MLLLLFFTTATKASKKKLLHTCTRKNNEFKNVFKQRHYTLQLEFNMKGFFDKIGKDVQKAIKNNNSNNKKSQYDRGGGKSLGGTKPGKLIPDIWIVQPGPIGVKLETTSQNHAIIAEVSPGGAAESVGLQRGDIICHPGTDGMDEVKYKEFLAMVKSPSRPLRFDVKRMVSMPQVSNTHLRADVDARRQAVIAAAEDRNSKHKAKTRPIPKTKGGKIVAELTKEELQRIELQKEENIKRNAIHMADKPLSEEAKKAVEAAKLDEAHHANQLGYNPYEARKVTAGQASTASVAMTHGTINAGKSIGGTSSNRTTSNVSETSSNRTTSNTSASSLSAIPPIQPPSEAMIMAEVDDLKEIDPSFDEAFSELITANPKEKISKSLRIIRKLIVNATSSPSHDPKRKVRISDPNNLIQSSIIDMFGAVELMLSTGFIVTEEDEKTILYYDCDEPSWLKDAFVKMEIYENKYK